MQIAIITGEASGDRVGGQLAAEIKARRPDAVIWGSGGKHLRAAGAEVLWDSSRWGIIGAAAAIRVLPRLLRARRQLHRALLRRRPDVLVPIDSGAFNLGFGPIEGLCPWTRRHLPQTRILYYFPPGSWRRTLRGTSLLGNVDRVATPFPWSEAELRRLGVDAVFVGHPLLDLVRPSEAPARFAERYGIDVDRPMVGLLPGSRPQEIAEMLPVELAAASIIYHRVPGVQFLLGLSPTVERAEVVAHIERHQRMHSRLQAARPPRPIGEGKAALPHPTPAPLVTTEGVLVKPGSLPVRSDWLKRLDSDPETEEFPIAIVEDATYDMMAASDVLLTASGTATLEAAILNKPMVITYRMSRWNTPEYLLARRSLPPHVGMPNLILGRRACPEFLQDEATPENLAGAVISLLLEPERLFQMKRDLREAVSLLGEPGGAARAAEMVVALAEGK